MAESLARTDTEAIYDAKAAQYEQEEGKEIKDINPDFNKGIQHGPFAKPTGAEIYTEPGQDISDVESLLYVGKQKAAVNRNAYPFHPQGEDAEIAARLDKQRDELITKLKEQVNESYVSPYEDDDKEDPEAFEE